LLCIICTLFGFFLGYLLGVEPKGGGFSQLTNAELKVRSLQFVFDLRKWRASRLKQESEGRDRRSSKLFVEKEDEWKQITNAMMETEMKASRKDMLEYNEKYKMTAILLRDEILSRIPRDRRKETRSPVRFSYVDYKSPHNLPWGVAYVAESLEWLAKSLG
jgi:hypothetical protein